MHGSRDTGAHAEEFTLFSFAVIDESATACAWFNLRHKEGSHFRINLHFESHLSEHVYDSTLLSLRSFRIKFLSRRRIECWSTSCLGSEWIASLCLRCKFSCFCGICNWMNKEAHLGLWTNSKESHVWTNITTTCTWFISWLGLRRCFDHFDYFWLK